MQIYTVCKGRTYPGSAGPELSYFSIVSAGNIVYNFLKKIFPPTAKIISFRMLLSHMGVENVMSLNLLRSLANINTP